MPEISTDADIARVLVTGATGPHGGAVVRALLSTDRRLRALTRNPAGDRARELTALGAEPVAGDLLDRAALVRAMDGVGAVYAVTTPFGDGPHAEVEQGEQLIAAAREAAVPWLVLGSVASATRGTNVPHFRSKWQIEQRLRSSGVPHTVVAPTYFYENLGDPWGKISEGELALPLPETRPLQQLALADLGAAVASLLARRGEFLGRRIELATDDPTPRQMAAALSTAGGRPIRYRQIEVEEIAARSADLAAMYRFLADTGYQVDLGTVRATFPDVQWSTFTDWVGATARR